MPSPPRVDKTIVFSAPQASFLGVEKALQFPAFMIASIPLILLLTGITNPLLAMSSSV